MRQLMRLRAAGLGLALGALVALAACGKSTTTVQPGVVTPPATANPIAATAGDADDGLTYTLQPGGRLTVVLSSTYWTFQPPSDTTVLRADGTSAVSASPDCIPGQGCGTVTARFVAVAPGTTQVAASRTTCGEALGCNGDEGHYQLTVVVTEPDGSTPPPRSAPPPGPSPSAVPASPAAAHPVTTASPANRPPAPSPPAPITPASVTPGGGVVTAGDSDDGQVLVMHTGDRLVLVLHSTYWQIQPASPSSVLASSGTPAVGPAPGCVPGVGCGTVTAQFVAESAGLAQVSATRTSCGEAMACTATSGQFRLTVEVTAAS